VLGRSCPGAPLRRVVTFHGRPRLSTETLNSVLGRLTCTKCAHFTRLTDYPPWNLERRPRVIAPMQLRAAALVVIAAVLAVGAGCSRNQATAQGGMAFPPAAVKLATVQPTEIQDTSEYVATLKSLHSTSIQPQIDGQITKIFVKSGDRVAEGQPL